MPFVDKAGKNSLARDAKSAPDASSRLRLQLSAGTYWAPSSVPDGRYRFTVTGIWRLADNHPHGHGGVSKTDEIATKAGKATPARTSPFFSGAPRRTLKAEHFRLKD
jgi:hypothetical protein